MDQPLATRLAVVPCNKPEREGDGLLVLRATWGTHKMVEKCRNRAHAAALSLLPTLQVKNFDFAQNFSDALSDVVRGKPLGKQ